MKHLLRFLIPILLVASAAISGIERSDSGLTESRIGSAALLYDSVAHSLESSTSDIFLNIPRHITSGNVLRLNNASKRTSSTQRNNLGVIKTGKTLYAGTKNNPHKELHSIHHLVVKTAYPLISLGKLII